MDGHGRQKQKVEKLTKSFELHTPNNKSSEMEMIMKSKQAKVSDSEVSLPLLRPIPTVLMADDTRIPEGL